MYKKVSYEELEGKLTKIHEHTLNSYHEILEALSKLKNIDCYKDLTLYCENELDNYAKSLN